MQPNRDQEQWQQPSEQPSQAPYEVTSDTSPKPVVTLTPDGAAMPATPIVQVQPQHMDPPASAATQAGAQEEPVRWQATEYIRYRKGILWFVVFGIIVIIAIIVAIFLMRSVSFAILVPIMAVALLVYEYRPPRVLNYTLSRQGLHANDHLYSFGEFKGFGVIRDEEEYSVMLIPTKRFRPGVYIYFPEKAGEAIVDMLAARLPMQELHMDLFDRLIRKLRI